jgi:aminoglycoside phosphotransferase (APT) family kinase protein
MTGRKAGRCQHVQVPEVFSMEESDQAVMDFRAGTEVWKFLPKPMEVWSGCRG